MRWTKTREGQYSLDSNELDTSRRGTVLCAYLYRRSSCSAVVVFDNKVIVFPEINKEA
jgi:hypothetical protein